MGKSVTPLSEEEQLILRNKAKAELDRLMAIYNDEETKQLVEDFKSRFGICEIVYKVVLDDHQFNKTGQHPEYMKVTMAQVPHALKYAGYDYEKDLLNKLFGAEDRIGKRSVKKLRDSLTHSMNQKAIDELKDRLEELNGYMDDFLGKISTYDAA